MKTVTSADGTRIAFERSGTGTPLVLVHGTTADHTRWANILPALSQDFTVFAMDRRGRGASGDAPDYTIEREYEDVAAVIAAAGPGASLLGHSFGALCSMEAALRVGNLRRMILYEPAFSVPDMQLYEPGQRDRLQAILDSGDREKLLETFFTVVVEVPPAHLAAMRADPSWPARVAAAHTVLREMADEDYEFQPERFRDLDVPTLMLSGETSPEVFRVATRAVAEALPQGRIAVLEGQGHVANTTAPDLFLREVMGFLTE